MVRLNLLHSERPKRDRVLAVQSAIRLTDHPDMTIAAYCE